MARRTTLWLSLAAGLISFLSLPTGAAAQRVFYIDYSSGSNNNNGSKSEPWKTHPYMRHGGACDSGGPSYTHEAGDHFIFKGGVTWPAACFEMLLSAGGSSSAQDYYGVDTSWHSGASFTRPLFDLNYQVPAGNHVIQIGNSQGYVTIDNIEIAHQGVAVPFGSIWDGAAISFMDPSYHVSRNGTIVSNCYIHDWASSGNFSTGTVSATAGGVLDGNIVTGNEISDANGYGYISGAKTNGGWGVACYNCLEVKENKIHHLTDGCHTAASSCHDNEFYGIVQGALQVAAGSHSQIIEDSDPCDGSNGVHSLIYNNAIHDNHAGVNIFVRYDSTIYNNVMWNNTNNYAIRFCHNLNDSSLAAGHIYNNTIDSGNLAPIGGNSSAGLGTLYIHNNVFITSASQDNTYSVATVVDTNNRRVSSSEATTYGFTSATKYAPTSSDPNVVGKGLNFSSSCSGAFSKLCLDTAGAPWFGTSYAARSASWDLGAYVYGSQSAAKPNPPTALNAVVLQ